MGTSANVIDNAVEHFYAHVESWFEDRIKPRHRHRQPITIEDLVEDWLEEGEAVLDCYKEFRIFVSAVAVIFAGWHDYRFVTTTDESEYHSAIPWYITRALKSDDTVSACIFDPYAFQQNLCRVEETKALQLMNLVRGS